MKKLLFSAMFVTAFLFFNETKAQVRFNLNVNLGARPAWGLPGNYAGDYYYLPEIDSYYDIPTRQFIYFDGRDWTYASALPYQYRDYDLYGGYKVIVNEPRPFLRGDYYRNRYRSYYNTYHAPVYAQRNAYGYNNDRNNRGRVDDRFNRGRENERNDHARDERNNRGRDNDHDRGRRGGRG